MILDYCGFNFLIMEFMSLNNRYCSVVTFEAATSIFSGRVKIWF